MLVVIDIMNVLGMDVVLAYQAFVLIDTMNVLGMDVALAYQAFVLSRDPYTLFHSENPALTDVDRSIEDRPLHIFS